MDNGPQRHWCFTVCFADTAETLADFTMLDPSMWRNCRYCVYQLERGEEGTLHFQGYVEFTKPMRMAAIKKFDGMEGAHLEARLGSRDQARNYCMEQDTRVEGPWEYGVWDKGGQGKRNDVKEMVTGVLAGKTDIELVEAHPVSFLRFYKGIDRVRLASFKAINGANRIREGFRVVFCYGPAGTGKTTWATNYLSGGYFFKPPGDWWDGYEGEAGVIMDDFSGKWCDYSTCKLWLDKFLDKVPIKGGYVPYKALTVVITSNLLPYEWYRCHFEKYPGSYSELKRRIHRTLRFTEPGVFKEEDPETFL